MCCRACRWLTLFLVLLLLAAGGVQAGGMGTTGAAFLREDVGPRAVALGGAYTALADDGFAGFWNPAGLVNIRRLAMNATYREDFSIIDRGALGAIKSLNGNHFIGTTLHYVKILDSERTEHEDGGSLDNTDLAVGLQYAYRVTKQLAVGVGGKYIRQQLAGYKATEYALDAGIQYNFDWLRLGASMQNYGSDIYFINPDYADPLPRTYRMGAVLFLNISDYSFINTHEVKYLNHEEEGFYSFGVELPLMPQIAMRTGFQYELFGEDDTIGEGNSVNYRIGFAFQFDNFTLDYATIFRRTTDDQHLLALGYTFK